MVLVVKLNLGAVFVSDGDVSQNSSPFIAVMGGTRPAYCPCTRRHARQRRGWCSHHHHPRTLVAGGCAMDSRITADDDPRNTHATCPTLQHPELHLHRRTPGRRSPSVLQPRLQDHQPTAAGTPREPYSLRIHAHGPRRPWRRRYVVHQGELRANPTPWPHA